MIAVGGVYDPRIHLDEVVMPVLKKWRIFERDDFTGEAANMQEDLGVARSKSSRMSCDKFEVSKRNANSSANRSVAPARGSPKNPLVSTSAS